MSILKRFSDIMASNINAMLDKAEDPEKMVDQLIRNLNDDLNKVKSETASIMADEARAKRELDQCKSDIEKMVDYATRAIKAGNDDDARNFLQKKASLTNDLAAIEQRYNIAKENSDKMKEMYKKISSQLDDVNARRNSIKVKIATAKAQQKVNKIGTSINSSKNSFDSFSRMEEKANKMLDEANAMAELNSNDASDDIDDLMNKYNSNTSDVDNELAELKKLMDK